MENVTSFKTAQGLFRIRNRFKDFDQKASGKVMSYLRTNKPFERENSRLFREEIGDPGVYNPTIIAFGRVAHAILTRNFTDEFKIFKIQHYSNCRARKNIEKK